MKRRFLIASSAAAVLLRAAPAIAAADSPASEADVIVIGGGLAGLNAATAVRRAGASVILLEARDRLGGRAYTVTLPTGLAVDLGAQFVADAHTRLHGLIRAAGLNRVPSARPGDDLWAGAAGGAFERQPPDHVPLSLLSILDAGLAERSVGQAALDLSPAARDALDRISAAEYLRAQTWFPDTSSVLKTLLADELCLPLEEVSGFELLEQLRSLGGLDAVGGADKEYLQGGVGGVVDHLARGLGGGLVLSAPVSAIVETGRGLRVEAGRQSFFGRRVVLAIPPQLIPSISISPGLPEHRARVLQGFKPGSVIKTVLQFPSPWWRAQGLSGRFVNPGARYSLAVDGSPADGSSGVLIGFTTSAAAQDPAAVDVTEEARIADFMGWLSKAAGFRVPDPLAGRSLDWSAEVHSRGGFASRRPIGGWSDAPDLFSPYRNLYFAGTETADEHRSYMEGALQSGERAAALAMRSLAL